MLNQTLKKNRIQYSYRTNSPSQLDGEIESLKLSQTIEVIVLKLMKYSRSYLLRKLPLLRKTNFFDKYSTGSNVG